MQPRLIRMMVRPPDLIGDLMHRRMKQLQIRHPQFKQQFLMLERKLRENATMLKNRKQEEDDQLYRNILEELQLKQYKLIKNHPKFSIKYNIRTLDKNSDRRQEVIPRSIQQHQSQRSSEMSQTGFKPYHINNFKKSLSNFRITVIDEVPIKPSIS